jgi:hypothetical protein
MPKPKVNKREDAVHCDSRCKYYADGEHGIRSSQLHEGIVTCAGCAKYLWGITTITEEEDIWDIAEEYWYGDKGA